MTNKFPLTNRFPPEVAKKLKAYVYRLVDPRNGETFYVGKGTGDRVFAHVRGELKDYADEEDEASAKIQTIRDIRNAGLEVIHVIHRHGMDDNTAFEVEAALIDAYPGAANGIDGHNSDNGPANAAQLVARYGAEEADFGTMKCMVIAVNRTVDRYGVYDAVRGVWRVNIERAKQAEYVFAANRGIIAGAFKPKDWYPVNKENRPHMGVLAFLEGRSFFIGDEAPQKIQDSYIGKRFTRPTGAQSPFMYINI
ncbi:MAG: hypothetical protein Pg6C_04820 [Treponemataceae bacterium]|nr:MAG: hypothetical protein Pg6C_04820 [Treponemataceae bacterium]